MLQEVADSDVLVAGLNLGEILSQDTTLSKRTILKRELTLVDQTLDRHRAEGLRYTRQTQHMTTIHTLAVLLISITVTTRVNQLTLIGNRYRHTRQVVVAHKGQHLLIERRNTVTHVDIVLLLRAILSRYGHVEQLRCVDLGLARNNLVGGCAKGYLCTLRHLEIEYHLTDVVTHRNGDVVGVRQQERGANRCQTRILRRSNRHHSDLVTRLRLRRCGFGIGSRFVVARHHHARCQQECRQIE